MYDSTNRNCCMIIHSFADNMYLVWNNVQKMLQLSRSKFCLNVMHFKSFFALLLLNQRIWKEEKIGTFFVANELFKQFPDFLNYSRLEGITIATKMFLTVTVLYAWIALQLRVQTYFSTHFPTKLHKHLFCFWERERKNLLVCDFPSLCPLKLLILLSLHWCWPFFYDVSS